MRRYFHEEAWLPVEIIAAGGRQSYFVHDDWANFAPGLKSIDDATARRRHILLAFEMAAVETDARERERHDGLLCPALPLSPNRPGPIWLA
jgi:hypothetical protein